MVAKKPSTPVTTRPQKRSMNSQRMVSASRATASARRGAAPAFANRSRSFFVSPGDSMQISPHAGMPYTRAACNARRLPVRAAARYQQAMRQVERPALLILAAVLAFAALGAAVLLWGLR